MTGMAHHVKELLELIAQTDGFMFPEQQAVVRAARVALSEYQSCGSGADIDSGALPALPPVTDTETVMNPCPLPECRWGKEK